MARLVLSLIGFGTIGSLALDGQCTEEMSVLWVNQPCFSYRMRACAVQGMGAAAKTSACLAKAYPAISGPCVECFGKTVECGRDNCAEQCASQDGKVSQTCLDCTAAAGCETGLTACTGIAQNPLIPPDDSSSCSSVNAASDSTKGTVSMSVSGAVTTLLVATVALL
jgi:hypothetical protein